MIKFFKNKIKYIFIAHILICTNYVAAQESRDAQPTPAAQIGTNNKIEKSEKPAKTSEKDYNFEKSIMFTEEQLNLIMTAVKSHQDNKPINLLLPDLFPTVFSGNKNSDAIIDSNIDAKKDASEGEGEEPDEVDIFPPIALNSILYFAENNWVIWINNYKYKMGDIHHFLDIEKVTPEYAILSWSSFPFDRLDNRGWESYFTKIGNTEILTDNKYIIINPLSKKIIFIIFNNGKFVSAKLSLVQNSQENIENIDFATHNINLSPKTQNILKNELKFMYDIISR